MQEFDRREEVQGDERARKWVLGGIVFSQDECP